MAHSWPTPASHHQLTGERPSRFNHLHDKTGHILPALDALSTTPGTHKDATGTLSFHLLTFHHFHHSVRTRSRRFAPLSRPQSPPPANACKGHGTLAFLFFIASLLLPCHYILQSDHMAPTATMTSTHSHQSHLSPDCPGQEPHSRRRVKAEERPDRKKRWTTKVKTGCATCRLDDTQIS